MVVYFAGLGLVSIANLVATHGDASDNPVMHEELLEHVTLKRGRRHHADKGYWSKENILKNRSLGLQPNIVPKDVNHRGLVLVRAVKEYDNDARKHNRGLIEGVFGGITTTQGMRTRFRKDCARKTHLSLLALTHQLKTYFRATVKLLTTLFATTPSNSNFVEKILQNRAATSTHKITRFCAEPFYSVHRRKLLLVANKIRRLSSHISSLYYRDVILHKFAPQLNL
jgi:hypothetical protein